jgi:hypothetical protein
MHIAADHFSRFTDIVLPRGTGLAVHARDDWRKSDQLAEGIIFYLRANLGNLGANLVT